jgi:XTP/dITP diphosphohydrolase
MRCVIATGNKGKLAEFQTLLADCGFACIAQSTLGIADADETGTTFIENAIIKARHASQISGLPALADDSGLCVHALNGAPGLISAHYAGVHGDAAGNISKLVSELKDCTDRRAYFVSVIVFLRHALDPKPIIAQGIWHGQILHAPVGAGGFGYDPIFFDPSLNQSAAELDAATKNQCSHRGKALQDLLVQLRLEAVVEAAKITS